MPPMPSTLARYCTPAELAKEFMNDRSRPHCEDLGMDSWF
jgi:hypothetical protein